MASSNQYMTKHEQILKYIESLKIGQKISVRQIAKKMEVSEGTAYRAIKEAENIGLVSTKERIGTVRIEKSLRFMDQLTFQEVAGIVEGKVLGGEQGLHKSLHKLVIGAMELEDMLQYIDAGSLLIVGNRVKAHIKALEQGAGVLITGGFDISEEAKYIAEREQLPVISSKYDTFTVASMINRAMFDRIIRKKIMLVEDVMSPKDKILLLKSGSQVAEWRKLADITGHERFPVVDEWNRVVGVITAKDVADAAENQPLDRFMTRNPLTVTPHTPIATAAHLMVSEGIEIVPVVDHNRKLVSVIRRPEIIRSMQLNTNQNAAGGTYEEQIWNSFTEQTNEAGQLEYTGVITPQMTNHLGTVSEGILTLLTTLAAYHMIKQQKRGDLVLDNMSLYFLRPLQLENHILLRPKVIELSRKFGKVEVEIYHHDQMAVKALLTAHVIEQG